MAAVMTSIMQGLLGVIHYLAVEQESFTLIIHGSSFTGTLLGFHFLFQTYLVRIFLGPVISFQKIHSQKKMKIELTAG
jgi:membrane protein insertase Oxa1/YidC/SpoIIIJ